MYAHGKYAVLVCLQGMDTSGKDSLIREVFKDFNVRGVEVHSFKVPTEIELKHKGFSRSIYALGAIKAALWLIDKKKGFFNMSNVLGIN